MPQDCGPGDAARLRSGAPLMPQDCGPGCLDLTASGPPNTFLSSHQILNTRSTTGTAVRDACQIHFSAARSSTPVQLPGLRSGVLRRDCGPGRCRSGVLAMPQDCGPPNTFLSSHQILNTRSTTGTAVRGDKTAVRGVPDATRLRSRVP